MKLTINYLILTVVSSVLLLACTRNKGVNKRKVYADYHVPRLTRKHDGTLGIWKYAAEAKGSALPNTKVNYNPDLIDENGNHQIASLYHPLVGMQSELDPDYLEYQILSAKTAYIDGFFVEWGYYDHSGNNILLALLDIAKKYDFEIGVNWVEGWMPEEYDFKENLNYLLGRIYNQETAITYQDKPVIPIFAGNLTKKKFSKIYDEYSEKDKMPLILRQLPIKLKSSKEISKMVLGNSEWYSSRWYNPEKGFTKGINGYFGWVPARLREINQKWDRYATKKDAEEYLQTIMTAKKNSSGISLRMNSVTPGFDNRSSASWGQHDLSYISRDDGSLYKTMWQYNLANRQKFNWIYIPTWNDWTENTQIEPTIEEGDKYLKLTEKYASEFKGKAPVKSMTQFPFRLFKLRKRLAKAQNILGGFKPNITNLLDKAAIAISKHHDEKALNYLNNAEIHIQSLESKFPSPENVSLSLGKSECLTKVDETNQSFRIRVCDSLAIKLKNNYFEGFLKFRYKPLSAGKIEITSKTNRITSKVGDYGIIASLNLEQASEWENAKVKLYDENISLEHQMRKKTDFKFYGNARIQKVKFIFKIY